MGEWPLVPIGEIATLFDAPHQTAPLDPDGPVTYLNVGDIRGGRIALNLSGRVSEPTADAWTRRVQPRAGDVVFGYEAKVGEAAMLTAEHRWCLGRRVGLLRPNPARIDSRYLAYAWYSEHFQDTLRAHRIRGTTIESIRLTDLPRWTIALPSLVEQRRIAGILGALDDKIELNRRKSETLEETAQALFRSWFVDFHPARAKAEGRDPGLPADLADRFPSSIEATAAGVCPQGWRMGALGDHVDIKRGLSYRGDYLASEGLALHNLNSINEGGGYKADGLKRYTGEYRPHHLVRPGDVVVTNTEQGHERRLIGHAALIPTFSGESGLFSHHLYRVRPKSDSPLTSSYICQLLNSPRMHDTVSGYSNGTTVQMLPIEALERPLVVVPPRELIAAFDRVAQAAAQRNDALEREVSSLTALRDAALPRLMAGALPSEGTPQGPPR